MGFQALATWSDGCTEQVGCDAGTSWTLIGDLTLGACASNTQTITANQIPCGSGGAGTVNANYNSMNESSASTVIVTNDDIVSTVDVTPNSTVGIKEGASQPFKAKATFSDGCTEQVACGGLLGATTWTVTGDLTEGGCTSNKKTISANQIPCGVGGSGIVNATYGGMNDQTSSNVSVLNVEAMTLAVTPDAATMTEGSSVGFKALATWSAGCTQQIACLGGIIWTLTGDLTAGACMNNVINIKGNIIPCAAGGAGTVNATYNGKSDTSSSNVTVTNTATISSMILTPVGPVNLYRGQQWDFYCVGTWSDGCTNSESNPKAAPPTYSLAPGNCLINGTINSGTGYYTTGTPSTTCVETPTCSISGISDSTTVSISSYPPCSYLQKIGSDHRVTSDAGYSQIPSLVWTWSEFGVSWNDSRDGNDEIYFARVSSAGDKIGSDFRVTNDASYSRYPSLSWTGSEFGVSWQDYRDGNYEIYFARISSAGAKIGSDLRVTYNNKGSGLPSLSWTGSEFGVGWMDSRDGNDEIYFARVSSAGAKQGGDVRISYAPHESYFPSLVWTGSEFGVSWDDARDFSWEVYFARISSSGVKIGSDITVSSSPGNSWAPSLDWTGSEFGVSWQGGDADIYFSRVSSSGTKLGSDLQVTLAVGSSIEPSLAWTGSEFGLSWQDLRDGNFEIYFARVSSAGAKIGSNLRVTSNASFSTNPFLSWNGSEFGVSWSDWRDGNSEIYLARIGCGDCNLASLDIIPVASSPGGTINLAEGATVNFIASCSYTGSTCDVLLDDCGQGQGVNWLYSGPVSLSTLGPSTSTIATAGQIPCGAGGSGQVSGLATYGAGCFSDSTNITVLNNDTVSTVDVTPNSTVTLAEGASQLFKAKATFSDACTEQVACGGLLGATTWTVTGNLLVGSTCAANQKTIRAAQIPCGAGGSGTVNATYSSKSDAAATSVTVTNMETMTLAVTPDTATVAEGSSIGFQALATWSGGCTLQQACNAGTTWTLLGSLTAGGCASNVKRIKGSPIPCGFGGGGTVNANYNSKSDPTASTVTVTNVETMTLAVTPNAATVAEGSSVGFKALATWSAGCTQQQACNAGTTWTLTGDLTAGACAADQKTITATQIPCGAGGSGTVNATYNSKTDPAASTVTVTNDDVIVSVSIIPGGPLNLNSGGPQDFDCVGTWSDGCTNSEANPQGSGPGYTLPAGNCTSNGNITYGPGFYTAGTTTSSCVETPVCTISGMSDSATVNIGSACPGDTDCDGMPDAWELAHSCMHFDIPDAMLDYDVDGLENIHEYYNGWDDNLSDPCVAGKPKRGRAGMGYFGDADGNHSIGFPDLTQMVLVLSGNSPSYDSVYPSNRVVQDLDGNGSLGFPDLALLTLLLSGNVISPSGWPTTLDQETPTLGHIPTVAVGQTVAIRVRLTKTGSPALARPGFGVVFSVIAGSATLLGGEGAGVPAGSRYDLTNLNGEARIVLRVDAAVTIKVHVEVPSPNPVLDKIAELPVVLPADVEITGTP